MLKPDWLVTWLISLHNSSFNIQKILCPTANDNPILFSTPITTQTDRPEWVHWRWGQTDFPGCLKTLPVSQQSRPRLTPEKLCSLWNITNQCHTQQSICVPAMRCRATLIGIMPLYVASLESGNVAKQMEKNCHSISKHQCTASFLSMQRMNIRDEWLHAQYCQKWQTKFTLLIYRYSVCSADVNDCCSYKIP